MIRDENYSYQIIFSIRPDQNDKYQHLWSYKILSEKEKKTLIIEAQEWFDTESEARLAAMGHIYLLEKGEK